MKSILTIIAAVGALTLGGCATKTSSGSCCATGKEQKCSDGDKKCEVDGHKHDHPHTAKKKK